MGLTKATYAMIEGAQVNVLDYGADPTGLADSSAAIQAAITASSDVVIPEGTYLISSTINLPNRNTRITGSGTLTTTTTLTDGIFLQVNRGVFTNIEGLFFTGASIGFYRKANDITTGDPFNDEEYEFNITNCSFILNTNIFGIYLYGSREGSINNCYFETGSGVRLQTCINVELNSCVWKNCTTYGIYESDNTQGTKVAGGTSLGCAIWLKSTMCNGTILTGVMADFNDKCIIFEGIISAMIVNCYLSSRTKSEVVYITGSSSGTPIRRPYLIKMIGNTIVNNYAAITPGYADHDSKCIVVENTDFCTIETNSIHDYTDSGIIIKNVVNSLLLSNSITGYPTIKGTGCIAEPNGDCVAITIHNNTVGRLVDPYHPFPGVTTTDIFNNYGYTSEAGGENLIPSGSTSYTWGHSLGQKPGFGSIQILPVLPVLPAGTTYWVSSITDTTITLNFSAPLSANLLFQWSASVKPF